MAKPQSAQDLHVAVSSILDKKYEEAAQRPYDRKMLKSVVGNIAIIVETTPVAGTPGEYHEKIVAGLEKTLAETDHADGEYISGKIYFTAILDDIKFVPGIEGTSNS